MNRNKLKALYKEQFGKNVYHWWSDEQITEKMSVKIEEVFNIEKIKATNTWDWRMNMLIEKINEIIEHLWKK